MTFSPIVTAGGRSWSEGESAAADSGVGAKAPGAIEELELWPSANLHFLLNDTKELTFAWEPIFSICESRNFSSRERERRRGRRERE